jgi:hypothetical protein
VSSYSKLPLSGSTDGRGIKVAATSIGSGTTIHTANSSGTLVDNLTLFAYNSDTVSRLLTLGWGGTTSPDDLLLLTLPPANSGLILVAADLVLRNSLVIKASADAANVVVVHGYVNRIS